MGNSDNLNYEYKERAALAGAASGAAGAVAADSNSLEFPCQLHAAYYMFLPLESEVCLSLTTKCRTWQHHFQPFSMMISVL